MDVSCDRRRNPKYPLAEREHLADLVRKLGARGAREAVSRRVGHGTLLKIAAEFGITLKKGRRPASASEPVNRSAKVAA